MTISEPNRLLPTDAKTHGMLFQPSRVRAVWRLTDCPGAGQNYVDDVADFESQLADYLILQPGCVGRALYPAPVPAVGAAIETDFAADRLSLADSKLAYEVSSFSSSRVPGSRSVWEVAAELKFLEAIPDRGHALVTKTTRQRTAQAWRSNPFVDGSPDSTIFYGGGDPGADPPVPDSPVALSCSEIGGLRVDINGQPLSLLLDQHVMTISFVVRAPYVEPRTDTITTTDAWTYWTNGDGASMVGNRNSEEFYGWPAYSLLVDSVDLQQIEDTTFHRVNVTMVHDQWWHLEQVPATLNGAMPPMIPACSEGDATLIFQTNKALWLNPYLIYSDFTAMMNYVPIDSRQYIEDSVTLTGDVP